MWIDAAENMQMPGQGALGVCPSGQGAAMGAGSGRGGRAEEREEEGWFFWTGQREEGCGVGASDPATALIDGKTTKGTLTIDS